ncbi:MAG: acetylglutamate kinase [Oligoflexales bacterium]|nr:acetylglutamate kinase [Oligoflexales bacterium]
MQNHKKETIVIKLSGKVVENKDDLTSLAHETAKLVKRDVRVAIVHGGGKQVNDIAEKLGFPQRFVSGRRVTDDSTLNVVKMVFAGLVSTDVTSALVGAGLKSVGISGVDGNTIMASKRAPREVLDPKTRSCSVVDYGYVGDITEIDTSLPLLLMDRGYIPVIASLGVDPCGRLLNINADTIAAEIAIALSADRIIYFSDVNGIYKNLEEEGSRFLNISIGNLMKLVKDGTITGGMIPKIESISKILSSGVKSAHVAGPSSNYDVFRELFTENGKGTTISR